MVNNMENNWIKDLKQKYESIEFGILPPRVEVCKNMCDICKNYVDASEIFEVQNCYAGQGVCIKKSKKVSAEDSCEDDFESILG